MPTDPKPKLKAQVVPVYQVRYHDMEQYVHQVFGFEFDLLYSTGSVNGMILEYQARGSTAQSQQAKELRNGRRVRNLQLMLDVLVADGYIPSGKYVIDTRE